MKNSSSPLKKVLALFLGLCLMSPPSLSYANSGGNADAKKASGLSMILMVAGAVSIGIGVSYLASQQWAPGALWTAAGIAEIAGAMAASKNASKADQDTADQGMPNIPTNPGGDPGGNLNLPPGTSAGEICQKAGTACTCSGSNCSNPKINLPNLADVRNALSSGYLNNPEEFPPGFSLDEALSKLDNEYAAAEQAVAAFNKASDSGAFNGDGLLADSGDLHNVRDPADLTSGSDRPSVGSGSLKDGSDDALKALAMRIPDTKRDPRSAANQRGLSLEDARSGRLLTIFERTSRAIRGEHNRDITLAKIEKLRKLFARKKMREKAILADKTLISPAKE